MKKSKEKERERERRVLQYPLARPLVCGDASLPCRAMLPHRVRYHAHVYIIKTSKRTYLNQVVQLSDPTGREAIQDTRCV